LEALDSETAENSKTDHAEHEDAGGKKSKKTNVTLALDDYVIREIKKEAKDSGQSLNVKINGILRKHASFYRVTELYHGHIPPDLFQFR
jgi:hypothetical protein